MFGLNFINVYMTNLGLSKMRRVMNVMWIMVAIQVIRQNVVHNNGYDDDGSIFSM